MQKLVSIVIPVYNVKKYLSRCIDSIISQTYHNLEILLIDDGSTDGSAHICDEYASKDNRIRVVHKKNGGVSSARNTGLELAKGDYIGFVDSDDYIHPNMYQVLVNNIEIENADIAICGFYDEKSPEIFVPYWNEKIKLNINETEQLEYLLQNKYYTCSCWDKLFKKDLLNGLYLEQDITQYEDLLFVYEAMKKSQKAIFTSEAYYYYCTNQGSASTVAFNDSMMAIIDVSETILNDIEKDIPELLSCAKREFIRNNIMCAINAVKSGYNNQQSINRIQNNIRKLLKEYLLSDASKGYKINAFLVAMNWRVFCIYAKKYGRKE